jgi:hypothetical protein
MQEGARLEYRSRHRLCWLRSFVVFVHCLQGNFGSPSFSPKPLPSKSFPIHRLPITPPFDDCWQYHEINMCNRYFKHTCSIQRYFPIKYKFINYIYKKSSWCFFFSSLFQSLFDCKVYAIYPIYPLTIIYVLCGGTSTAVWEQLLSL